MCHCTRRSYKFERDKSTRGVSFYLFPHNQTGAFKNVLHIFQKATNAFWTTPFSTAVFFLSRFRPNRVNARRQYAYVLLIRIALSTQTRVTQYRGAVLEMSNANRIRITQTRVNIPIRSKYHYASVISNNDTRPRRSLSITVRNICENLLHDFLPSPVTLFVHQPVVID